MLSLVAARRCCHLANATELLTSVVQSSELWPVGGSELRALFFVFCGPKYTKLSLPVWECPYIVCNGVFLFTTTCCFPEIFAIKSRSFPKSCRVFMFLGRQISRRRPPNFWPNFINLGHHRTCGKVWWRSAKRRRTVGDYTLKKERNQRKR